MVTMRTVKRLAASYLGCGQHKIWLDPNEASDLAAANSRASVRRLVKNGLIIKKPSKSVSRARLRQRNAMKRLGRHTGFGKRQGTREARRSSKSIWVERARVLRRLLVKYRAAKKIDSHLYRELYAKSKGNIFRNKRVLIEFIHKAKAENEREASMTAAASQRRQKNLAVKDRRASRKTEAARLASESYEVKA